MKISFHKKFEKQYAKLPQKTQKQFTVRLQLFLEDKDARVLNVHRLKGSFRMYLSMNVNSDVRALFVEYKGKIIFEKIGTHSELYK